MTGFTGSCHCGTVSLRIAAAPPYVNQCNCSLCTRTGGIWGYYRPAHVEISGATTSYVRADIAEPALATHFCLTCGSVTHWSSLDATYERMGVNMRMFNPEMLAGVEIRKVDGRSW